MMEESKKILLLGAGGHCLSVIDSLLVLNKYQSIGIIDNERKSINFMRNIDEKCSIETPVIGTDEDLERLYISGYTDAFITIGSIGDVSLRKKLYSLLKNIGFNIPNIIDKSSTVSDFITLGEGIYIGKKAIVNMSSKIGNCAIINTSSIIEHECVIGNFVHVAPGSILCGNVHVEDNTHIGAGSTIKQGIHVGMNSIIGMGSVVIKNIGDRVTAYGNPCREEKYE